MTQMKTPGKKAVSRTPAKGRSIGTRAPARRPAAPETDWDALMARLDVQARENREQADTILRRLGITA